MSPGGPSSAHHAVLDADVLDLLAESLGDLSFVHLLVAKYRALLPGRVERLTTALEDCRIDDARDAVKSLRVSSTMVGALEVAGIASLMEAELRRGSIPTARSVGRLLAAAELRADRALGGWLDR